MELNRIAGRTTNDFAQYPVFPWILSNYTSERLDLADPTNFRDLSKPIGVQNEASRKFFEDRYSMLQEQNGSGTSEQQGCIPAFHYGSHYSCSGFVLWYMMRLEPYTSLHIYLQDGKFDRPDRLFDSVAAVRVGDGSFKNGKTFVTECLHILRHMKAVQQILVTSKS